MSWLQETKLDAVAEMISKGDLKIPGFDPRPANIDALVEAKPSPTSWYLERTTRMAMASCLHLPQVAAKLWLEHPT